MKLLEQERLLAQQVVLELLAASSIGDVGYAEEQADLFHVAIVELLGIEHQPPGCGGTLEVHLISLDPCVAREGRAKKRAKLRQDRKSPSLTPDHQSATLTTSSPRKKKKTKT